MRHRAPIIVTGMHRSGTSMITRVLEELGLFMGWRRDQNDEALFFLHLNEWLLSQTGHHWDNPPARTDWPGEPILQRALIRHMRRSLSSLDAVGYWGLSGILAHRKPFGAAFPWGWKDPRNTITLPLWLDLFPDAQVLHVRRHGIDVAKSLVARNKAIGDKVLAQDIPARLPFTKIKPLWLSPRCGRIEDAFVLWEDYLWHAERYLDALGPRAFDFRFEDFLDSPAETITQIADFCRLAKNDTAIARLCGAIATDRAYAHRGDPDLVDIARRLKNRLAAHGYGSAGDRGRSPRRCSSADREAG